MADVFLTYWEGVAQLTPMLNLPRLPLYIYTHTHTYIHTHAQVPYSIQFIIIIIIIIIILFLFFNFIIFIIKISKTCSSNTPTYLRRNAFEMELSSFFTRKTEWTKESRAAVHILFSAKSLNLYVAALKNKQSDNEN